MRKPYVALVAIGDELTTGAVVDKNCSFLAGELTGMGCDVVQFSIVRDRISEIVESVEAAVERSDLVITTGGLGPTSDDLTREALAKMVGVELYENASTVEKIQKRYEARNIPFNPASLRQAQFPIGAEIIENPAGTADCFQVILESKSKKRVPVISLPGIPSEVVATFREKLITKIEDLLPDRKLYPTSTLRCFGLSESHIATVIDELHLPDSIRVAYRPYFPEVILKFTEETYSGEKLAQAVSKVRTSVGEEFFIASNIELSQSDIVGELLIKYGQTVAFAESCTGGQASSLIVNRAGSSSYFQGGIISYSNLSKTEMLDVSARAIKDEGAVSEQVAKEMALGVREKFHSSIGISVTGVAGPEGGRDEKPVGTVWFGISSDEGVSAFKFFIPFERNRFRQYCAHVAIDLVRRKLLGFPLFWERR